MSSLIYSKSHSKNSQRRNYSFYKHYTHQQTTHCTLFKNLMIKKSFWHTWRCLENIFYHNSLSLYLIRSENIDRVFEHFSPHFSIWKNFIMKLRKHFSFLNRSYHVLTLEWKKYIAICFQILTNVKIQR